MDKEYYINIQSWMVQKLKLSRNELLTYAIVYGFSQDGESQFLGSSKYISYALGVSRNTAIKALDGLTGKGLIVKTQEKINDVVFNRYKANLQAIKNFDKDMQNLDGGYAETALGGYAETALGGYAETGHSNKYKEINNSNDKGIYKKVVDLFNDTCVSYPKVHKISEARKRSINARLKTYSIDDFKKCFEMAEQSDFMKGKNNRDWQANFDWMISDKNMAKILDGNYNRDTRKNASESTTESQNSKYGVDMNDYYDADGHFDTAGYMRAMGYTVEE